MFSVPPGKWLQFYGSRIPENEICNLVNSINDSASIIRIIKSRRMRWAGHVARMGEKRNVHSLLVGKPEGK
jgi:hypothetical protein